MPADILPHPEFPDCLFCPANDSAHAWRMMRAFDSAGIRAGFPTLAAPYGVAVSGRMDDVIRVSDVRAVVDSVE